MSTEEGDKSPRPAKRKRVTVSCLACNRRKVKCDRTYPCNNCRARNESDTCEYMEGHTPAPADPPRPPATEVEFLRSRMEQLENHIVRLVNIVDTNANTPAATSTHKTSPLSNITYPTPFSNHTPAATATTCPKSSTLDRTFLALDDLSRGYTESPNSTPRNETPNHQSVRTDVTRAAEAWPNIFLFNDGNIPSARYTQNLYDIVSAIPKDDLVSVLIDHHFTNDGVFWHFVQENVFKLELAQFTRIRFTPNLILVDPAWLTLLIAMLRLSIHSMLTEDPLAATLLVGDKNTLESMDVLLNDAFELAMYGAGAFNNPQLRILQALLVSMSHQHLGRTLGLKLDKGALWHDMAISLCKHLRLNCINDTVSDNDLPVDPAFPPSSPLYIREWSARLSHCLLFMDEVSEAIETDRRGNESAHSVRILASKRRHGGSTANQTHSAEISTPPPRNFRDEDLWNDGLESKQAEPHPSFVLTEIAWQLHGFRTARYWKVISQLIRDPTGMTPEIIRTMDSELRQGDYELLSLRTSHQLSRVQDILCESFHGSYQQRVLRLHRHYFLRSYSDPSYSFSQTAALSAARAIIKGHKDVVARHDIYNPRFLTLVFFSHHVTAAILLFIHGCLKPSARQGIQEELQSSHDLFESARPPNGDDNRQFWSVSVSRGRRFIEAMLKTISTDPPTDLLAVENYMMDLSRRGLDPPEATDIQPATTEDTQPFILPSMFSLPDSFTQGYIQNDVMVSQDPPLLDWDTLFRGF